MSKIIAVHSYRRGTGKSHVVANMGSLLAIHGYRVGVMDFNFVSPSLPILFGMNDNKFTYTVNDYIWGKCEIQQTAYDVTPHIREGRLVDGQLFLIPASTRPKEIARVLQGGYYMNLLVDACFDLLNTLALDFVVIDTPAGLHEEAQLIIALCDVLIVILRPDRQDFQGTGVILDVARKLGVPHKMLVVNEVPPLMETAVLKTEIEQVYQCDVSAVLPHTEALTLLASNDVFVLRFPDHPLTAVMEQIAQQVADNESS